MSLKMVHHREDTNQLNETEVKKNAEILLRKLYREGLCDSWVLKCRVLSESSRYYVSCH